MNDIIARGLFPELIANHAWFFAFAVAVCMIVPYLFGSLNFAIIISKFFYKDDIRKYGSKNAGMTNMLRTYGKGAAGATLLGDVLKAVFAACLGYIMIGETGAYIAGLFCILGHVFPVFYKFKGGKGVLTTATMILCLNPLVFAILFLIFVIIVIGTKYISLGSIMCVLIYPVILPKFTEPNFIATAVSIIVAFLVVFLHRENIKRLLNGNESKLNLRTKGSKNEDIKKDEDEENQ